MTKIPRFAASAIAAAVLLSLGACSTAPTTATASPETIAAAQQAKAARSPADNGSITGSRMPAKSTDRLVKAVGNTGAKEMERERGPDPGSLNKP